MHVRGPPRAWGVGGLTVESFPLVRRVMLVIFVFRFDI